AGEGGDAGSDAPRQRAARLAELGIELPVVTEVSAQAVAADLGGYVSTMLDRRVPLRAAAGALTDLVLRAAPSGSANRVADLDDRCPPDLPERLVDAHPFPIRDGRTPRLAGTASAALLASLAGARVWWLGTCLGVLAVLLAAGGTRLVAARRPDRYSPVLLWTEIGWQ